VPTGKVKWYDTEKGFGFLSDDAGGDVFLHANALPEGVTTLKGGTRVEFGIVEGRRGSQALQVKVLDPAPSVAEKQRQAHRKPTEDMVLIIEDLIKLLDGVSEALRKGKYPDKTHAGKAAQVLRAVATDLEA
jgi:CspA family cold shock protein